MHMPREVSVHTHCGPGVVVVGDRRLGATSASGILRRTRLVGDGEWAVVAERTTEGGLAQVTVVIPTGRSQITTVVDGTELLLHEGASAPDVKGAASALVAVAVDIIGATVHIFERGVAPDSRAALLAEGEWRVGTEVAGGRVAGVLVAFPKGSVSISRAGSMADLADGVTAGTGRAPKVSFPLSARPLA